MILILRKEIFKNEPSRAFLLEPKSRLNKQFLQKIIVNLVFLKLGTYVFTLLILTFYGPFLKVS